MSVYQYYIPIWQMEKQVNIINYLCMYKYTVLYTYLNKLKFSKQVTIVNCFMYV